jgi:hypothetical protein
MRTRWTLEMLRLEALKHKTKSEFSSNGSGAYQSALRKGKEFLDTICLHMASGNRDRLRSGENNPNFKWGLENLASEALKYKTRIEFWKNGTHAYRVASAMGILNEICAHMPDSDCEVWTSDELKSESVKYSSRGEFQKNSPLAYNASWRRGPEFLDEICDHMRSSRGSSIGEKELLKAIKNVYSDAKSLRDMKVCIPNRAHIRGFEIDIFIPELRKGIEFDGTHWHSFDALKKSHPKWSDEDLYNYHEIKDAWFASKYIQILHIKEEDWKRDKEACIKKCLEFLQINEKEAA